MPEFVTMTQLAVMFSVSRAALGQWMVEAGLCKPTRSPADRAEREGWCKVLNAGCAAELVLWNRQRAMAAITEVVIAMRARGQGMEARII
jgi:hypothetical protein